MYLAPSETDVTINAVSETRQRPVFYTRGLFQTAHCETAESRMGDEEACLDRKQKRLDCNTLYFRYDMMHILKKMLLLENS